MPRREQNKLTDRKIKSLIRAGGPAKAADGSGLTLTISPTGYAAWVLRYRFGGKEREITIGGYQDYSLKQARDRRDEIRQQIAQGVDPARYKQAQKAIRQQAEARADTFADLAWQWFNQTQAGRLQEPAHIERALRLHLIPALGALAPRDIRPAHIIAALQKIIDGGAPAVANDCRAHVKNIFDYGVLLGELEVNPAAQISRAIVGQAEPPRTRSLSLGEIRTLFQKMARAEWFGRDNEIAVRLLLMLGVRKRELTRAEWCELDLDAGRWVIPRGRVKGNKHVSGDFAVPLSSQAVALFRELHIRAFGSEYVLPARVIHRSGHGSPTVSDATIGKALLRMDTGIEPFTLHDLRRTMRSHLSALGVPFAVAERCLNHKLPGMGEIYDRHDMFEQRADALARWAECLEILEAEGVKAAKDYIGGAPVVELSRRRA